MKKLWNAARIGILVLMFAMLFGMGDTAEAAPPSGKVSNIKQTEAGKNSVTVTAPCGAWPLFLFVFTLLRR